MDKDVYKEYVDKLYDLSGGTHKLLGGFQRQLHKPRIFGYWPEKLITVLKKYEKDLSDPVILNITLNKQEAPPSEWHIKDSDPEEIISLKNSAKKLHKQEALLHAQLCRSRSSTVRYDLAIKICTVIGPELDDLYDQIKRYNTTGSIPIQARKIEHVSDVKELYDKMNSLKSRLSRLKKLIPVANGDKLIKLQKEEIIKLKLIQEIKNKIGE